MFLVELITSSFLDLISKQARLHAPVSAFLCLSKRWGGGDQISFPGLSVSRPLAMESTEADKGVCHTHSGHLECDSRQGIQVSPGLLRLDRLEKLPSSISHTSN